MTLTVAFDRVGRHRDVEPIALEVPDVASPDDLSEEDKGRVHDAVAARVSPMLGSSEVDLRFAVPKVYILVGGIRDGGTGTLTLTTAPAECRRCDAAASTHTPCCTSHGLPLCCADYRRTHFVDRRPCCTADREAGERP